MSDNDVLTDEQFRQLDFNELMNTFDETFGTNQPEQQVSQEPEYQQEQVDDGTQEQYAPEQDYNNSDTANTSYQNDVDPALYKEVYDKITSPFKASGKEFQVRNVDEAISLMQKGVDYTRKQQALKPRLAEMRTLEEQGMLGNNLNYAIDLFHGNPQAIARLIKEKGIDVNQLLPKTDEFGNPVESQDEVPYIPNNYAKTPAQNHFQEVLEELQTRGSYQQVDAIIPDLDVESKKQLQQDPDKLLVISDMIQGGHFQAIKDELEHRKIVDDPSIKGLNDLDAIGLIAYHYFGMDRQNQAMQQQQQQYNQQQQQYIQQQQQYQAVQQRKQGVSPVRSTPGRAITQYDPLTCSDEDFAKIDINELMRR